MKDVREQWYEPEKKIAVTIADVVGPASALARGHLAGPTSAYYLAKALAAVALFGAETSEADETVILQMKCTGPLGGVNVECTSAGTLRGYTEKKLLDDFDGLGTPDDKAVLGKRQIQVVRSVPGRILSQAVANSLDGYLAGSLQRRALVYLEAAVSEAAEIITARGVLVEALPDSAEMVSAYVPGRLSGSSRSILARMGLPRAELRQRTPLVFACRCSPERARAMLAALSEAEKKSLPPSLDVTCHMCGRIYSVKTN